MNLKSIILLLIITSLAQIGFAQNSSLSGYILSFEKQPLKDVSVSLQNTSLSALTNEKGYFMIRQVPPGIYTLAASTMGYSALKQNVLIEPQKPAILDLQLSENHNELQEVVIIGIGNQYKTNTSSIATRTDIPLLETPQSVQVISRQVIKDRQAFTLNDIAPLMTGVKANNAMGGFSLRGFTGYNPNDASFTTFNGIRGTLYLWSQQPLLYNIEAVEVLRGPASVLFSEGMPGGVINFITKKPQTEKRFEFTAAYGSWNAARISADATGPLSKNGKLLYRAIVGYDRTNSFRDYQKVENIFVAPSLTYQFSSKTNLNLEINYAHEKSVQQYDRGVYVKDNGNGTYDFDYYPKNLTVQSPSDFGKTNNTSATLTFDHRFDQNLSLAVVQRYVRSRFNFADHFVSGAIRNDSISRSYSLWDYDQFNAQTSVYANYKFGTGWIKHSILVGVDYNRFGWSKNDYRSSPTTRISILNPDYTNDVPAVNPAVDYYDDNKQATNLIGGYVQDQISFGTRFKALLSVRHDDYSLVQTPLSARDDLQGDASEANAWLPRFGLVYLPLPNISLYGSYTKSFAPQLSNSGGAGGPFPPRKAEQFEIGYKGDFFKNQLSTMVAVYNINYNNILAADPSTDNPNRQTVVPGTRSKGLEVTLQGNIKGLSILTGYAYNDHQLTSTSTIGKDGDRYVNAPHHIANVLLKYNFRGTTLNGLGVGLGGRYTSDQVGNLARQTFVVPSSKVLDALANYEMRRFNFQLNVYNFTNARYFNGGLSRNTVASLGNPINFRFGISYTIF
ncbi:Metal-pseudopaline receptor CntO [Dyadobacter sp. CECT 9623]|uniref:Metal-pseudopaline receptor CntO n=1 Tax=Dyadobacter linearis TaxID=2823330 RepID=A0ABM8UYV5_9BACT|nr:TonB-dependent receptor [Dyadobacter sp. CECT 9623]CAG5075037.1 Metal-pseudopaline receptor CntO [Dyadobacter sp. CECT 9623]